MEPSTEIRTALDITCSSNSMGYRCKQPLAYCTNIRMLKLITDIYGCSLQRMMRLIIIIWRNCGKSLTSATIQVLPGEVARVDIKVARPWKFKAGQYLYLYIPALGLWTSHPFSVAWESEQPNGLFPSVTTPEKSGSSSTKSILSDDGQKNTRRTVSFLIRKREGFTKKMLQSVGLIHGNCRRVFALAEGPFGT